MRGQLTCLDLFCGCGGFTLGMERAGFRTLAAIVLGIKSAAWCEFFTRVDSAVRTQPTETRTAKRFFPRSHAALVRQNGRLLAALSQEMEVVLYFRKNQRDPCGAEVISGEHHAEIGLWFEGKELAEYDGVFFLPGEVGEMLAEAGYIVPHNHFA